MSPLDFAERTQAFRGRMCVSGQRRTPPSCRRRARRRSPSPAVERREILAPQCVDQSQNAGADVACARTHARTPFLRAGGDVETATLRLIDMPGYGHAAASKEKTASWTRLIRDFLRGRAPLLRVFLLIDGRHGANPIDIEMLDLLDRSAMSYQIVLTKHDEVKAAEREVASPRRWPWSTNAPPRFRRPSSPRRAMAKASPSCAPRSRGCWRNAAL